MAALDLSASALVNAGSGILLAALGLWVLQLRPRRAVNIALAGYCGLYGLGFIGSNLLLPETPARSIVRSIEAVCFVIAACGLAFLAVRFPSRVARRLIAAPLVVASLFYAGLEGVTWLVATREGLAWPLLRTSALWVFYSCVVFTSVLLPIRYAAARPHERELRRNLAFFATAVFTFPAAVALAYTTSQGDDRLISAIALLAMIGIAATWLAAGERSGDARPARAVAWTLLLLGLAGIVAGMSGTRGGAIVLPGYNGAARILGALLLVYAILRHQLLGIDVRLRWTIRRGTVAAIFLAVFVVATASAQEFLSNEYGYVYGGIAAAAVMFAIAPLQRFADRVADRALPQGVEPREDAYRSALTLALADRAMSVEEERHLAKLATALGLSHERALELREEVRARHPRPGEEEWLSAPPRWQG